MGISLNPQLMLLVFVIFIASIYLLNKWLYQPIFNFMDSRDAMIKNDLDNASGNDSEIESINAERQNILDSARKEATAIKEKALLEAKAEYERQIEALKAENEKDLAVFLESAQKEKQSIKSALLAQMPEFQKSLNAKIKQI